MAQETFKVAVYGSLRKGLSNHIRYLSEAKYIGRFDTPPEFNMYSVNLAFPALKQNGNTSVVMEVYEVTEDELTRIDQLEGYNGVNNKENFYNQEIIETPYGDAFWYEFNKNTSGYYQVAEGDWKKFKENHKILENATR